MDLKFYRGRDCTCPGTPHDEGDGAFAPVRPSLAVGLQTQVDYNASADARGFINVPDLTRRWFLTYARLAVVGWNLVDDAGKPVPFDPDALVSDYEFALPIVDAIDDDYRDAVMRPLGLRPSGTSQPGRTNGSTSPVRSTKSRPRRSSPATSAASTR